MVRTEEVIALDLSPGEEFLAEENVGAYKRPCLLGTNSYTAASACLCWIDDIQRHQINREVGSPQS
jgi:hypothetical protein